MFCCIILCRTLCRRHRYAEGTASPKAPARRLTHVCNQPLALALLALAHVCLPGYDSVSAEFFETRTTAWRKIGSVLWMTIISMVQKVVEKIANFGWNVKKMVKFRMLSQPLRINIKIQYLLTIFSPWIKESTRKRSMEKYPPLGAGWVPNGANLTHTDGSCGKTCLLIISFW